MRSTDIDAALTLLEKTMANPRLRPVHKETLRKAKRELRIVRRSGDTKRCRRRLCYAVRLICDTLRDATVVADEEGDVELEVASA